MTSEIYKLLSLLTHVAKITEENDLDIFVKFTFHKGKREKDIRKQNRGAP